MEAQAKLRVKFWGVRGSIPTPIAANLGYGGNTACLEVQYAQEPPLILDAGSGARQLSSHLLASRGGGPLSVNIFLTHFHWDHIQGIPFMPALYLPTSELTFHSAHPAEKLGAVLRGQMASPYFPVEMPAVRARIHHRHINSGGMTLGSLEVRPFALRHPDGAVGYRVSAGDECIVYATDHEHGDARLDQGIMDVAQGADILIYDAQFTPEEYSERVGWGHSTWLEGTRLAKQAAAKQLVLFHHDPSHDDGLMAQIEECARREFPNTIAAREGWSNLD